MSLSTELKREGYDLIDGPIRTHRPLQLWLKRNLSRVELYYDHLDHAFQGNITLNESVNPALDIAASQQNEYNFNIGITVLENVLKALGIGAFDISAKVQSGKKVTIKYSDSHTTECPIGNLQDFFAGADFKHPNPILLKQANLNNILVISGIVFAKRLITEIETSVTVDTNVVTSLNNIGEGKLTFATKGQNSITMTAGVDAYFPIAVKANRLVFNRGVFKSIPLLTDARNIF